MIDPSSTSPLRANVRPEARYILGTADPTLTALLRRYLELMESFAQHEGVSVARVDVRAYHDPEENADQLVVTQWVRLPEKGLMSYWDRLGDVIEEWANSIDPGAAELAAEWIALEVRPDAADAAA